MSEEIMKIPIQFDCSEYFEGTVEGVLKCIVDDKLQSKLDEKDKLIAELKEEFKKPHTEQILRLKYEIGVEFENHVNKLQSKLEATEKAAEDWQKIAKENREKLDKAVECLSIIKNNNYCCDDIIYCVEAEKCLKEIEAIQQ